MAFKGCLFASYVKVKVRQKWELKWAWLTPRELAFAARIEQHAKAEKRSEFALHAGVSALLLHCRIKRMHTHIRLNRH